MSRPSSPSSPSSKRSPKRPAGRPSVTSQAPRETVQVRPSWLEPDPLGPPPLQGAAEGRPTLDVRPSWLEGGDDAARVEAAAAEKDKAKEKERAKETEQAAAKARATPKRASRNMRPSVDPAWEEPAPPSEPGRSAIPPPLPTVEQAPPSRPGKKRG